MDIDLDSNEEAGRPGSKKKARRTAPRPTASRNAQQSGSKKARSQPGLRSKGGQIASRFTAGAPSGTIWPGY